MGIKVNKIPISSEFKRKMNSYFKRETVEITYYNGYIVQFDNCNLESISPHKILLESDKKNLLILHYGDYMENDGLYFLDGKKEPFTITQLKNYVQNIFKK